MKQNQWDEVAHLVPPSTLEYIKEHLHEEGFMDKKDRLNKAAFTEIENWVDIKNWISNHKQFIIYGTGTDASYIWNNISSNQSLVFAFCDKKALTAEYTFYGKKVLAPIAFIKEEFSNLPILISTRTYRKEVYLDLCNKGVHEDRLMVVLKLYIKLSPAICEA